MAVEIEPEAHRAPLRALSAAIGRRSEAVAFARRRMAEAAKTQSDWWGVCRHCKTLIEGTPAEIAEHRCGNPS